MLYKQRLKDEQKTRALTYRVIALVFLFVASFAITSCQSQPLSTDTSFQAYVQVGNPYKSSNIRQVNGNLQIKSRIQENPVGIQKGTQIWLDFTEVFLEQNTINLPNPLRAEPMIIRVTNQEDVFIFERYVYPQQVDFVKNYKPDL